MILRRTACQRESKIRMLAFDQLPRSIRDFMNESSCDFPPVDVLNYYVQKGETVTLKHLRESERVRREQFRAREVATVESAGKSFRSYVIHG